MMNVDNVTLLFELLYNSASFALAAKKCQYILNFDGNESSSKHVKQKKLTMKTVHNLSETTFSMIMSFLSNLDIFFNKEQKYSHTYQDIILNNESKTDNKE